MWYTRWIKAARGGIAGELVEADRVLYRQYSAGYESVWKRTRKSAWKKAWRGRERTKEAVRNFRTERAECRTEESGRIVWQMKWSPTYNL